MTQAPGQELPLGFRMRTSKASCVRPASFQLMPNHSFKRLPGFPRPLPLPYIIGDGPDGAQLAGQAWPVLQYHRRTP